MKKRVFLFGISVLLVAFGLWDFFTLRLMQGVSPSTCNQHLSIAIIGAVLLVWSPSYTSTKSKWIIYVLQLFLFLGFIFSVSSIFLFQFHHPFYILRHLIIGLLLVGAIKLLYDKLK